MDYYIILCCIPSYRIFSVYFKFMPLDIYNYTSLYWFYRCHICITLYIIHDAEADKCLQLLAMHICELTIFKIFKKIMRIRAYFKNILKPMGVVPGPPLSTNPI